MDKREYLSFILEKLGDTWPPAYGMLLLIKENVLDDITIDKLINVLENAAKNATTEKEKTAFQKSIQVIKQINKLEQESKLQDEQEIQALESMLEDL